MMRTLANALIGLLGRSPPRPPAGVESHPLWTPSGPPPAPLAEGSEGVPTGLKGGGEVLALEEAPPCGPPATPPGEAGARAARAAFRTD
eukprot:949006-Prorocentrum_minimum.AAC.1